MTIRFSKSGSTLRIGATTFALTVGLWFGSTTYAQTNRAASNVVPPAPSLQLQQLLNEGRSPTTKRRTQRSMSPASRVHTQRLDLDGVSNHAVQGLLETGMVTSEVIAERPRVEQRRVVSERIPNVTQSITEALSRPAVSTKPKVSTVAYNSPVANPTGVHQLKLVSVLQFEQKLVNAFGDRLVVTSSDDGRYVRVAIRNAVDRNTESESMVMLLDRETGKLQHEGPFDSVAQWHQLMLGLDSNTPAAKPVVADIPAEVLPMQQPVQQVAYQQQDTPRGTPVQNIDGLKGQVFISRDPVTGQLTLTGDSEDVAIVRREITRLSGQAKAGQPTTASIELQNARGNLIQERVQEFYDARYSQLNGPASIASTDNPNALVVVGSPEAVQAVKDLVRVFDVKQIEGAARDFRTFSLNYISAPDAADRLNRFFGIVTTADGETRIPAAAVEVIPDFRSNQVTVKGSQAILDSAAAFLRSIDVSSVQNGAADEVRVIQLKNTLASDIAFVIQNTINGQLPGAGTAFAPQSTNQNVQNNNVATDTSGNRSQLRSKMLSLMTRDGQGELIRSAILFDVRITADANSNSLIVTGPAQSIPLIVELVKQLDRLPDAESQIKVFELVYSDAQTIFDMLETLFNGNNQNAGQQVPGGGASNLPLQSGAGSEGASLINLRFSIEPRSNAIIASGPARDLQVIEDLLNRLDARAVNNFPAQVYRLSNAPAQDVADAINTYLDGRTDLIDADPRTNTGVPAVNRAVIVTPEVVSNSLIVSALPEYRLEIENIIRSLDRRPPMIQVKVLIAEVDLDAVEEFGVELGIQDSLLFDRGTSVAADGSIEGIGFPFNSGAIGNANATFPGTLAGQALSNLNVGRVNSSLGFGGLVLSAGNESVSILMRALQDRQAVRVLSKPQIMTMENLQGRVAIGASVARIAGSTQTNFGLTQDIEFRDVGVILEVTPRVSPDGLIVLTVNAEKSSVGPEAAGTAVGVAADGSIIRAQQVLMTEAETTLSARSGQTVVFSGLISEEKVHAERGAPILSDLPVIGPLFKFESDSSSRSELLIIMTPTLVTNDSDLTSLNHEAMDRMHWCMSDVADVYGSTDYGSGVEIGEAIETVYPDADPTGLMQPVIQNPGSGQPAFGSNTETKNHSIGEGSSTRQTEAEARSANRPFRNLFKRR